MNNPNVKTIEVTATKYNNGVHCLMISQDLLLSLDDIIDEQELPTGKYKIKLTIEKLNY